MPDPIGFAVMYRWRLDPAKEAQFRDGWERATRAIARERGGLGSRLHRADDGTWVAYAQWPSRATWERSQAAESVDPVAGQMMKEAQLESFPPILLEPVADLLQVYHRSPTD